MLSSKKIKIISWYVIIIILFSCSDNILELEDNSINIINTTIELNRTENTLLLKLETYKNQFAANIKEVTVDMTYIGISEFIKNNRFELYDNGVNGDIIPYNGIYTLLADADTLQLPIIVPKIEDIILEKTFKLNQQSSDSLNISVIVLGKAFRIISTILDSFDNNYTSTETINIDNSSIELQINTNYMYLDNPNTVICDREFNNNPQQDQFESYFEWSNSVSSQTDSNLFLFNTKIPFRSVDDCGGTGTAYLRFILHDLDTMSETIAEDITLIIYGCGDGICESGYEDVLNCNEDCK